MKQLKLHAFGLLIFFLLGGFVLAQDLLYEDCNNIDESSLRNELEDLNKNLFSSNTNQLSPLRIVTNQWNVLKIDTIIEKEVENAIALVKQDTNYLERIWSNWDANKAKALTEEIANHAFGSENFRKGIEGLANAVAAEITVELERITERVSSDTILCIQEFIGDSYGNSIKKAFEDVLVQTTQVDLIPQTQGPGIPSALSGKTAIGISTVITSIIARRVLQRLGQRVSQRIAGKIVGRVAGRAGSAAIPVIGWVTGLGLITWDVVDGNNGAFSTIGNVLTGQDIAAEIREDIAASITDDLDSIKAEAAREIADLVYYEWQNFEGKFKSVLELAEKEPKFKDFLGNLSSNKFHIVSESLAVAGEADFLTALSSGDLKQIVDLPASSVRLLKKSKSISEVLAWAKLAGPRFDEVVNIEVIYSRKNPSDFNKKTLRNLLAVEDNEAISKLVTMSTTNRNILLTKLSTASLKSMVLQHNEENPLLLNTLAWYVEHLPEDAYNQLIVSWTQSPPLASRYTSEGAKNSIANSKDPISAIKFLASTASTFSIYSDLPKLLSGELSIGLYRAKHDGQKLYLFLGIGFLVIIAILLVIISIFKQMFGWILKIITFITWILNQVLKIIIFLFKLLFGRSRKTPSKVTTEQEPENLTPPTHKQTDHGKESIKTPVSKDEDFTQQPSNSQPDPKNSSKDR